MTPKPPSDKSLNSTDGTFPINVAIILYPGFTALDFIGLFDPLFRLSQEDCKIKFCLAALGKERKLASGEGLNFEVQPLPTLKKFNLIILPGARLSFIKKLLDQEDFLNKLKSSPASSCLAAVCTGSLLLGAAGLLKDHPATTHPSAYELLKPFCAQVSQDRILPSGRVVTAGGVSAAIDLGLYLVEKFTNLSTRLKIQHAMDYPFYQGPRS